MYNASASPLFGLVAVAMLQRSLWSPPVTLEYPYNLSVVGTAPLSSSSVETAAMMAWQAEQLRADKGLLNLHGCSTGIPGCRALDEPVGTGDTVAAREADKQSRIRSTLYGRSLPLPSGEGYLTAHTGVHAMSLQQLCLGVGQDGAYHLTLYANADESGDGRLSAGLSTDSANSGYKPADGTNSISDGVDTVGWRDATSSTPQGCWCCQDGACGVCDASSGTGCPGRTMTPPDGRKVRGYVLRVAHQQFSAGAVPSTSEHQGCISYGQWRRYSVQTGGISDAHVLVRIVAVVEGIYAAAGREPSLADYDAVARPNLTELVLSPCDVAQPTTWHVGVYLGSEAAGAAAETIFTIFFSTRGALAELGEPGANQSHLAGTACCGADVFWRVPFVPGDSALRANVTVLSGALHAVMLQYDLCPRYVPDDPYQSCQGLCEVAWVTEWHHVTGYRSSAQQTTVAVSMGETLDTSDKRRAGPWYVGIKALPAEAAEFEISLDLVVPPSLPPAGYCTGNPRFCASATTRAAGDGAPLTTAADVRLVPLGTSAASRAYATRWLALVASGATALALLLNDRARGAIEGAWP